MANRHTLHVSKLEDFKEWLIKDGWEIIQTSSNIYEVLRAKKSGKQFPLIVYRKGNVKEHLSIADRDYPVVAAFLRNNRKKQTNADRIRSMSDVELANFIRELNTDCLAGAGEVDCSRNEDCIDCMGVTLEWLQSEAEDDKNV